MELLKYFLKNKSLEQIAKMILEVPAILDVFLLMLEKNPDWLEENVSGRISSSTLLELLERSYDSQKHSEFLTYLIEPVNGNDINDLIFEKILSHPDNDIKEKLLISLSHKKLKENHLRCLCNEGIVFECYFELAILYYTKGIYAMDIFTSFMKNFLECKYSYMAEELITELLSYYVASDREKYEYIVDLKNQTGDGSNQSGD